MPKTIDALRSNMQRRVDVLRVCQVAILQGVAATSITLMRDAEVEDQAPASSLVSQVVPNLHVAAPLACAGRDPESSEICKNSDACVSLRHRTPPNLQKQVTTSAGKKRCFREILFSKKNLFRKPTILSCALVAPE